MYAEVLVGRGSGATCADILETDENYTVSIAAANLPDSKQTSTHCTIFASFSNKDYFIHCNRRRDLKKDDILS